MSTLIVDGVKFKLWTPGDEEKEFHPMVKEHSKEIFGEDSVYFDIKHKLTSRSGIATIPDAYVITLSEPYVWYIVENELAEHPVYSHIVPQITKFVDSVEELETQREIRDILDREVNEDKVLKALIEKKTGQDSYRFLTKLLEKPPKITIIIDEITPEVEKASKSLKKLADTEIIEFKTFVREDAPKVRAHLFKPIYEEKVHAIYDKSRNGFFCQLGDEEHNLILYDAIGIVKHIRDEHNVDPDDQVIDGWSKRFEKLWSEYVRKEGGEAYTDWEGLLAQVSNNVRELVNISSKRIAELKDVNQEVHGRYMCFYKGKPSTKSIFAAFLLTKKVLKIRIRTDPNTFRDPQKWTGDKVYKGWFFKQGQEREFKITSKEQIPYAMELIKQSYEISGEH